MEGINDIRQYKRELRQRYRMIRENMDSQRKQADDDKILENLLRLPEYQAASALLCFVSTPIEVETRGIITRAFRDKKTVAVPKCLDRKGNMDFFIIKSLDELVSGEFALMEPDIANAPRFSQFDGSICILPAFAFDPEGYRLGFGKGYYDRFLRRYTGVKAGVCYNSCMASRLPRGRYDEAADYIITPKYVITVKKVKNNYSKEK